MPRFNPLTSTAFFLAGIFAMVLLAHQAGQAQFTAGFIGGVVTAVPLTIWLAPRMRSAGRLLIGTADRIETPSDRRPARQAPRQAAPRQVELSTEAQQLAAALRGLGANRKPAAAAAYKVTQLHPGRAIETLIPLAIEAYHAEEAAQ